MKKYLLMAAVLSTLVAGCGEGEDRQAKYLERAQNYFAEENYDKARIDARNVLQINPKNAEARLVLANISFEGGDIRKAYGGYQSVLDEAPENIDAHIGLTKLFVAVRGFDQALTHADTVLEAQPDNTEVMGFKAVALVGAERAEEAQTIARQTLAKDASNAAALGVMSQMHIDNGETEKALALLQQGEQANPDDARITMMKVAVYEKLGDSAALEKELIALNQRFPESRNYSDALAGYYIRESRFDEAEAVVRDYANRDESTVESKKRVISYLQQHKSQQAAIDEAKAYIEAEPDVSGYYISLAQLHMFTGDKEQALVVLSEVVDRDPRGVGSIDARNMIIKIHLADKNFDAATKIVAEVLDIEPENADALFVRAGLNLADNNLKAGIADLRVILKNDPENIQALTGLVRALEANGNEELALDHYKKLIALQKPNVETLASAARLAIKTEQYQEAEKFVRMALEIDAENPGLVTNLVRLLVLKEDWDAASSFAQRLIESEESKALGYYLQAGLDMRLDEKDKAIKNLELSLQHQANAVETLTSLAGLISEQQGQQAALSYVTAHCETYPEQAHCQYILGSLYAQDKQFDTAIGAIENALSINDQLVAAYRQLAKIHAAKGDKEQLEKVLLRGIEATNRVGLSFDLAGLYYQTDRFPEAVTVYENIVARAEGPKALSAKNNLAMIYAENIATEESLKQARALIVDLQDSENAAYLDTVGWVMYLTGDYEQAVSYLTAAVDKVGSSAYLQYHLGMAYYKNGETENAKQHLQLATQNEAEQYPGLEEAKTILTELQ
jgi:tetratricopeptide (TPR) repeat protein